MKTSFDVTSLGMPLNQAFEWLSNCIKSKLKYSLIVQLPSENYWPNDSIRKGYLQLEKFSWQKTAEITKDVYQDVLMEARC